jgi:hypothetical protein
MRADLIIEGDMIREVSNAMGVAFGAKPIYEDFMVTKVKINDDGSVSIRWDNDGMSDGVTVPGNKKMNRVL